MTGRTLRRRPLARQFSAFALLGLAIALGVALWQADAARQQRDEATRAAHRSAVVAGFLARILADADRALADGRDPAVSALLDTGAREIEQATELAAVERSAMYYALGSVQLARNASEQGLTLMQLALDQAGKDPVARFDALNGLAVAHQQQGHRELAETVYEAAREWLDQHPQLPERCRDELDSLQAQNRMSLNRHDQAEAMLTARRERRQASGEASGGRGIGGASLLLSLLDARRDSEALPPSPAQR